MNLGCRSSSSLCLLGETTFGEWRRKVFASHRKKSEQQSEKRNPKSWKSRGKYQRRLKKFLSLAQAQLLSILSRRLFELKASWNYHVWCLSSHSYSSQPSTPLRVDGRNGAQHQSFESSPETLWRSMTENVIKLCSIINVGARDWSEHNALRLPRFMTFQSEMRAAWYGPKKSIKINEKRKRVWVAEHIGFASIKPWWAQHSQKPSKFWKVGFVRDLGQHEKNFCLMHEASRPVARLFGKQTSDVIVRFASHIYENLTHISDTVMP